MFYCIDDIPILCYHRYLQLSGESPYKIAIECSVKNNCKYCGDRLDSIDVFTTPTYSPIVANFVYQLLKAFKVGDEHSRNSIKQVLDSDQDVNKGYDNEGVDFKYQRRDKIETINITTDNSVFLYVYNRFTLFIASLCKTTESNYNDKVGCLAATYAYKVLKNAGLLTDDFKRDVEDLFLRSGFQLSLIDKIIDLCPSTDAVIDVLKNGFIKKYRENSVKKSYELYGIPGTIAELDSLKNSYYWVKSMIPEIYQLEYTGDSSNKSTFKSIKDDSGDVMQEFKLFIQSYCPTNINHEFDSNQCKHCHYKSDGSNIDDLYEAYKIQFGEGNLLSFIQKFNVDADRKLNKVEKNHEALILRCQNVKNYIINTFNIREDKYMKWYNSIRNASLVDIKNDIEIITHIPVDPNMEFDDLLKLVTTLHKENIYGKILEDMIYTIF
jgi:hypothetical protein